MDLVDSHADISRTTQMDLLGCCAKFFAPISDYSVHNHPRLFSRANECRKWKNFEFKEIQLIRVSQFTCLSDNPCTSNFTTEPKKEILDDDPESHRRCALPQYISLSAALAFICVSIFLRWADVEKVNWASSLIFRCRLPILVKSTLIILMGTAYSLFIEISHSHIFDCYDQRVE